MIVTNEEWNALKKERDERQALLEKVFEKGCFDGCKMHTNYFCRLMRTGLQMPDEGEIARDERCPFLPFEVKK